MKVSVLSAVAAAFFAFSATSASAVPVAKPGQTGAQNTTMSEQVQHRHGHYGKRHGDRNRWRGRDRHDHRYDRYRGWNRYSHRPHGWRDRGCVAVGPVWFCK